MNENAVLTRCPLQASPNWDTMCAQFIDAIGDGSAIWSVEPEAGRRQFHSALPTYGFIVDGAGKQGLLDWSRYRCRELFVWGEDAWVHAVHQSTAMEGATQRWMAQLWRIGAPSRDSQVVPYDRPIEYPAMLRQARNRFGSKWSDLPQGARVAVEQFFEAGQLVAWRIRLEGARAKTRNAS